MVSLRRVQARRRYRYTRVNPTALTKLRSWLTLDEAAEELSTALNERVSEHDLLRLAIDRQIQLSRYLPMPVTARCQTVDATSEVLTEQKIEGICDIPVLGRAKLQLEHDYHWLRDRRFVPIDGPIGALVEFGDLVCTLPPDRGQTGMSTRGQSEFPEASVYAVRRSVLESFIDHHAKANEPTVGHESADRDRPLGERERATLLTVIAALARIAKVEISKPSKAAEVIERETIALGARVSARAIEDHLKRIPDALERRSQQSS